jgi:hypothetical protein
MELKRNETGLGLQMANVRLSYKLAHDLTENPMCIMRQFKTAVQYRSHCLA